MLVKFKLEGELKVELKSKKCNQMKCGNSKVLMLMIQEHFGMKHEMMHVSFLFSSKQYPSCKGLIKSLENIYHIGKVLIPFLSNFQPNKLTMDISSSWTLVDDCLFIICQQWFKLQTSNSYKTKWSMKLALKRELRIHFSTS